MLPALIGAAASLFGGAMASQSSAAAQEKNAAMQREFAQSGIQWKVEDAKKAGIHPLYALGANTASFSPSYVGDTALPSAIAESGQDISRAIDATRDPAARLGAYGKTVQDLTLTRMGLENELLASQIAKVRQAGHPPGIPGIGPLGDVTPTVMGGTNISPAPGWSDAQAIQNRYGEPAEWLYFPFVAGADAIRNIKPIIDALPAQVKAGVLPGVSRGSGGY